MAYYILHGPDEFSAMEKLEDIKKNLGDPSMLDLNTTRLDGKNLNLAELMHHTNIVPFLTPMRLVIVRNFLHKMGGGKGKEKKEVGKRVVEILKNMPDSTTLIFIDNAMLKVTHPVIKYAKKDTDKGQIIPFEEPQKGDLLNWIEKRAKQKGSNIESRASQALATAVGDNLRALDNELEKLSLYVNGKRAISMQDVETLCPYTADSEAFAMANAIGRQDAHSALDQLHKRLEEGQHPLQILAGIATQFRGLLEVKSMSKSGMSTRDIAQKKGWRSDYAVKIRLKEGQRFSVAQLVKTFDILLETDLAIKTGQTDDVMALDMLITRLCKLKEVG